MPIEIKEMHVKINVNEKSAPSSPEPDSSNESIVQECLDQMTKMLNDKEER